MRADGPRPVGLGRRPRPQELATTARGPVDPRLLHHARATRPYLLLSVVLGTVTALLIVAQAWLLATAVAGAFIDGKGLGDLGGAVWALLAVVVLRAGGDLVHRGRGEPFVGPGEVRSPIGAHRARRRARAGRSGRGQDGRPRRARHRRHRRARRLLHQVPAPARPRGHRAPGRAGRRAQPGLDLGRHHRRHRAPHPVVHGAHRDGHPARDRTGGCGRCSTSPATSSTWSRASRR